MACRIRKPVPRRRVGAKGTICDERQSASVARPASCAAPRAAAHAGTCAARAVLQGAALACLRWRGWWLPASPAAGGARYQSLQRVGRTAGPCCGRPAAACSPARAAGPRGCRWGARWGAQSRTCCTNSSPLRWSQIMKVGSPHSARRAPCGKAARLSRRRRPPEEFAQNSVLLQERHLCSRNGSPRAATRPPACKPKRHASVGWLAHARRQSTS